MVSDLGLTGSSKKSGYYLDGIRQKERFDNEDLVDQLERRIRAKAKIIAEHDEGVNQIKVNEIES